MRAIAGRVRKVEALVLTQAEIMQEPGNIESVINIKNAEPLCPSIYI